MKIIRSIFSLAILTLAVFLVYQYIIAPIVFENRSKIIHMIDADSYIAMQNGEIKKIQLIGVDAPETTTVNGAIVRQCFGNEATDIAANLFFKTNRDVRLESDSGAGEKDVHGRELKYVYLADGRLLNEELIKEGLARVYYDPNTPYSKHESFKALQKTAQSEKKGLWGACGDF